MRILLLSGEHPAVPGLTGGIGSYVADASRALADAGHEVHVLVCADGLERSDRPHAGATLHVRGLAPPLRWIRGRVGRQLAISASCRWHARSLGAFDVVEAPEWQAIAAGFAIGSKLPLLVCLQTPSAIIAAHDVTLPAPAGTSDWLERWTVRRASMAISLSQLLVDELRRSGWLTPATTVEVAPPVVHPSEWSARGSERPGVHRLVGIGRLEARKGFELLLDTAAQLRDIPGVSVELIGDASGPYADRLRERAQELGVDLHLPGRVERADLPARLAEAAAVVLPSRFDSFNLAGLEALAAGVPVVASARVGLSELADGSDGLTVVPRDALAFAEALRPLLLDAPRRARASTAARALADRCSPSALVADREARYRRIVG